MDYGDYKSDTTVTSDTTLEIHNKMKTRYIKLKNWFLLSIAGVCGLNLACSCRNPHDEPACIYGPPEMLNGGGWYYDESHDSISEGDAPKEDNSEKEGEGSDDVSDGNPATKP